MKNLFDYATKELSQDAFLLWLLDNWNEEGIGAHSIAFINRLTELNLRREDINPDRRKTKVWSQANYMDVGFDIYLKDKRHYLIVIEDKTDTKEHHQLTDYDEVMARWQSSDKHTEIFKIYYKTYPITSDERERIEQANAKNRENKRPEWRIIEPGEIEEWFRPLIKSESQVLSDYSKHVCKLIEQTRTFPKGNPRDWNFLQWLSFFKEGVCGLVGQKMPQEEAGKWHFEDWVYRGKVLCAAFYYHKDPRQEPLIEFTVREGSNHLNAAIHITTETDGKWKWKRQDYGGEFWDELRDAFARKPAPLNGFVKTRREKGQQTFAKLEEPFQLSEANLSEMKEKVSQLIADFLMKVSTWPS